MARGGYRGVAYGRTRGWRPQYPRRRRPPMQPRMPAAATPRMGMRVRKPGSTTATKTKQKLFRRGVKTGDNSSMSITMIGRKWGRLPGYMYRKVQGRQTDVVIGSSYGSCTQGQQNVFATYACAQSDLQRLKVKANDGVATEKDIRLFIGKSRITTVLRNQTNSVAHVTLYDIVCKRLPATTAIDSPIESWQKGYTDEGIAGGELILGNSPLKSPEFQLYWKVVRVTNHDFEPGEEHSHSFISNINRVIRSTVWDHGGSTVILWLTTHTLVVFHGSLGHESLTPATVGTIPIKLDYLYRREVDFGYFFENASGVVISDSVPKTIVNFDFMGENQDADMDDTSA